MGEKTLSLSQCKEYVRNIRDLEVSCYQQEMLLRKLKNKPANINREIVALERTKDEIPTKPLSAVSSVIIMVIMDLFLALVGAVIGFVGGFIVRVIAGIFADPSNWITFLIGCSIIGYIIALICLFYWHRDTVKDAHDEKKAYPEKLKEVERKKQNRKQEIEYKKKQLTMLPSVVSKSEQELQQTRDLLKKYYDLGFIYPKYRGMVPVCQIYEYLESGRCFSLLGPGGAYNLYESEVRSNLIISKLDDVISRLDDLSAGQQMLANVIRESNRKIDRLSQSFDRIEENTAMSAYYSGITAANTDYLAWLATFS